MDPKWVVGLIGAVSAAIGGIWGGFTALDTRYAHSADVRQQFSDVQLTIKEGQIQQLERERVEWAVQAQRRPLTDLEQRRYLEVQAQLQRLRQQLLQQR